jgi:hypothetical protein
VKRTALLLALLAIAGAALAQAPREGSTASNYLELLRADLRREKANVVAAGMDLAPSEETPFWRVYRDYEADVTRVADGRFALLREYAQSYGTMTDEKAAELMQRAIALDRERVALKERYFPRFAQATSARTAARFFQIEGQVEALLYLQLTADLPLFPRPGAPNGPEPERPR